MFSSQTEIKLHPRSACGLSSHLIHGLSYILDLSVGCHIPDRDQSTSQTCLQAVSFQTEIKLHPRPVCGLSHPRQRSIYIQELSAGCLILDRDQSTSQTCLQVVSSQTEIKLHPRPVCGLSHPRQRSNYILDLYVGCLIPDRDQTTSQTFLWAVSSQTEINLHPRPVSSHIDIKLHFQPVCESSLGTAVCLVCAVMCLDPISHHFKTKHSSFE